MVAQAQVQRETASRKTSSGLHWGINTCKLMTSPKLRRPSLWLLVLRRTYLGNAVKQTVAYAIFWIVASDSHHMRRRPQIAPSTCLVTSRVAICTKSAIET
jgi:hypothetical protein